MARGAWGRIGGAGVDTHLLSIAVIVSLALGAYWSSFAGAFVFDDVHWIVENDLIRDLRNFFLEPRGYRKQPNRYVGHVTFALNYAAGGLDPTGYHVVNVAIHASNALLVYALAVLLFGTPRLAGTRLAGSARSVAFLAAVLFVAHPLQTQAVSYVVQRYTSLSSTFYLLAVVLYVRLRSRQLARPDPARSVLSYAGVVVATLLAMKTKESTFTLPLALLATECFFFGATRRGLLQVAPLLATLAVIPATKLNLSASPASLLAGVQQVTVVDSKASRLDYLRTQLSVVVEYVRLLLFPAGQNVDHDHPVYRSFGEPRVVASTLVIALLCGAAVYAFVRSSPRRTAPLDPSARLVSFGILWFFLALSVESSIIPIADVFVEHRVYLPSAGWFVAVAVVLAGLFERWSSARTGAITRGVALTLGVGLAVATYQRNRVWADDLSLWTDAAEKSPGKARPHYNLGEALGKAGNLEGAVRQYTTALQIDPGHARARYNLGEALAKQGDVDGAIREYLLVVATDPSDARAHNNLGVAFYGQGRVDEAIAWFRMAIALSPEYAEAHTNLGIAYGRMGWLEAARQEMSLGMRLQASGKRAP